jgi:hypothetical protein
LGKGKPITVEENLAFLLSLLISIELSVEAIKYFYQENARVFEEGG